MAIQGIQTIRVGHLVYALCYNEEHAMLFGINDHGSDIVSFNFLQNDVSDDYFRTIENILEEINESIIIDEAEDLENQSRAEDLKNLFWLSTQYTII